VASTALVATQRCGKHIPAAMNQRATIEEAVFSLEAAPRLYKDHLRQLELELKVFPKLAVGRVIEKKRNSAVQTDFIVTVTVRLL
jgi:hypothetical protein